VADSPAPATSIIRKVAEFYTIALAQLDDGELSVAITATTVDEEEPQLLDQEIITERVATLDDALALIKAGVEHRLGP
jgi:hypothetical protein